jgi:hypothetical protein
MDPLLGNDRETNNEVTAVGRQRPAHQWTGWKVTFSIGSAPMAAHDKSFCKGNFTFNMRYI